MSKKSIIDQLRTAGAVAAHPNDHWVSLSRGAPKKVTMANPLYMDKKKLGVGDKIAIVDTQDYSTAFICRVSKVDTGKLSRAETLDLTLIKEIELS